LGPLAEVLVCTWGRRSLPEVHVYTFLSSSTSQPAEERIAELARHACVAMGKRALLDYSGVLAVASGGGAEGAVEMYVIAELCRRAVAHDKPWVPATVEVSGSVLDFLEWRHQNASVLFSLSPEPQIVIYDARPTRQQLVLVDARSETAGV